MYILEAPPFLVLKISTNCSVTLGDVKSSNVNTSPKVRVTLTRSGYSLQIARCFIPCVWSITLFGVNFYSIPSEIHSFQGVVTNLTLLEWISLFCFFRVYINGIDTHLTDHKIAFCLYIVSKLHNSDWLPVHLDAAELMGWVAGGPGFLWSFAIIILTLFYGKLLCRLTRGRDECVQSTRKNNTFADISVTG